MLDYTKLISVFYYSSGTRQLVIGGGGELPSDQMLSDLLDDVVNSMPDSDAGANLRVSY